MHRSGTSLVSGIFGMMGFSHGPAENMLAPAEDNPRGHWEYQPLVDVNDAVLASFGGTWDRPPVLPAGWSTHPAIRPLRERALRIIAAAFDDVGDWVWKDPRTCLTLPFWRDLLPNMKVVVCLRNPLDVAFSLQRREGFSLAKGGELWLTYMASAFLHISGLPHVFLFYEDLMRDWRAQVRRMGAFLGDLQMDQATELAGPIEAFVDSTMDHYQSSPAAVLAAGAIPYPARALYLMLHDRFAWRPEGRSAAVTPDGALDEALLAFALASKAEAGRHRRIPRMVESLWVRRTYLRRRAKRKTSRRIGKS
jgi:hypothetical protein